MPNLKPGPYAEPRAPCGAPRPSRVPAGYFSTCVLVLASACLLADVLARFHGTSARLAPENPRGRSIAPSPHADSCRAAVPLAVARLPLRHRSHSHSTAAITVAAELDHDPRLWWHDDRS